MVNFIGTTSLMFGSPFGIIVFGAGVVVGYLLSKNKRDQLEELDQAYDEMNNMLLEREGRIDQLEDYIDQLLEDGRTLSKNEPKKASNPIEPEDLTRIEGVGPKTAKVLQKNGIYTYQQLSETPLASLQQFLKKEGGAYLRHGHETWAKQAQLAANGDWEALEAWQKG